MPASKQAPAPIAADMTIADLLTLLPDVREILAAYGIHCVGCSVGGLETVAEACLMHSFDEETRDALFDDISELLKKKPTKQGSIVVTAPAAEAIASIAKSQSQSPKLIITTDGRGGFCLEFVEKMPRGATVTKAKNKVEVGAEPLILQRIGAAIIDCKEGRLKLELPGDFSPCGCTPETCSCKTEKKEQGKKAKRKGLKK